MAVPRFDIRHDPESGEYKPATIHARLTTRNADGQEQAVPMDVVSIEMRPDDIIKVEPAPAEPGPEPVLAFTVSLLPTALSDPKLPERAKDPIRVTFVARPQPESPSAAQPPEIRRECDVQVHVPEGELHWSDEEVPGSKDSTLHLEADGESILHLRVWYETFDPEARRVVYDPDKVEFTHWTGPETPPDVFNACENDKPNVVAGPGNNREHSTWQTFVELPSPQHAELVPPINTHIRVRVWPKGTVYRVPGAIEPGPGAVKLCEGYVPLVLEPSRVVSRLVEPTEPIPADGSDLNRIVVELVRERTGKQVTSGTYTFELDAASSAGGTLDPDGTTVTVTPETAGPIELSYTAPELTYKPGGRYAETLVVYRGQGAQRREIGRHPVYLSPSLDATVTIEKPGLLWDEDLPLELEAGETPAVLELPLQLVATNADPSIEKTFPVAYAKVTLTLSDGATIGPLTSTTEGIVVVELPELKQGLASAPPERRRLRLAADWTECDLDDDAAQVIDFYDEKVGQYAPFRLYPTDLVGVVKSQRIAFCEQLASLQPAMLERILAGTEYERTGVVFGTTYERMFRNQVGTAVDQLGNLFSELIGIAINVVDFGEKLALVARTIGGWVEQAGSRVITYAVEFVTTTMANALQGLANTLVPLLEQLRTQLRTPAVNDLIESVIGAWRTIAESISGLYERARSTTDLLVDAVNVIVNVGRAAVSAIRALVLGALELIGRAAAGLAEGVGNLLDAPGTGQAVEEWFNGVRQAVGATFGEHTFSAWGLGKICEQLYGMVLEELSALERGADWAATKVRDALDPSASMIAAAVVVLTRHARDIPNVPLPTDARISVFRNGTTSLADNINTWQSAMATLEMLVKIADTIVLIGEVFLMAASAFLSWGLAPAVLAPAMTAFEIKFGVVKVAVVHLVPMGLTLFGGYLVLCYYGWNTAALTVGGTP